MTAPAPPAGGGHSTNPAAGSGKPLDTVEQALAAAIAERTARVGVVGLGYVGLPLAVAMAEAGFNVTGVDVNGEHVEKIRLGQSPILDVPDRVLTDLVGAGRLSATADYGALSACDAIFVCVPTPFDANKTPDLSYVHAAAEGVSAHLRPGQLVVLQSTTYPGTTEEAILPRLAASGLAPGVDFFLAFVPERIDPGVPEHTVVNTPKVVGGLTPACGRLAGALMSALGTAVHQVSSPRVAEMTKLLENIFRAVNIALVNELALLCEAMGIDIWEVVEAAATKPFGFMAFRPGPGVGGHCIPIDPHYLAWKAREYDFSTRFIELAADINQAMPRHVVQLVDRALESQGKPILGSRILILGVAFKPDVDDPRNSPAVRIMGALAARGAVLRYHDPHIPQFGFAETAGNGQAAEFSSVPLNEAELLDSDAVLILVAHRAVDYDAVARLSPLVIDTTNAVHIRAPHVVRLGAPSSAATDAP